MPDDALRNEVLRRHGAGDSEVEELRGYTENRFHSADRPAHGPYPLADELSVATWQGYVELAEQVGVYRCLRERLVQLRFPIARGISETTAYQDATRRGVITDSGEPGLRLNRPDDLTLLIHTSPAGRIPVLIAGDRDDFEALLRALTRRNEPVPIPPSVGATMVAGYNNWDRVREVRRRWEAEHPGGDWDEGFRQMVPHRELYQDRFILLSRGRYSGASADDLGLSASRWLEGSLTIRLEHECAHYFTRRVFGSMANSLHDELIADYLGIVAFEGRFRADWFLRFLGLESFPDWREDGRLGTYRGDPPLSDRAFKVLQSVLKDAAENVERADLPAACDDWGVAERARAVWALSRVGLEEMAAAEGPGILRRAWERVGAPPA